MTDTAYTRHAETRLRQRGLREADIALIQACATPVGDETVFLRAKDVRRAIAMRKREIQQLERLSGCMVIIRGESVITAYHARRRTQKRALRRGRRSGAVERGRPPKPEAS